MSDAMHITCSFFDLFYLFLFISIYFTCNWTERKIELVIKYIMKYRDYKTKPHNLHIPLPESNANIIQPHFIKEAGSARSWRRIQSRYFQDYYTTHFSRTRTRKPNRRSRKRSRRIQTKNAIHHLCIR